MTIGYKASLYATQLLGLEFSADEQVVCIAENDACGIVIGFPAWLREKARLTK